MTLSCRSRIAIMPRTDAYPPTQAVPARHMTILKMVFSDNGSFGLSQDAIRKWQGSITNLLVSDAAEFAPNVFQIDAAASTSSPVGLTLSGLLSASVSEWLNRFKVSLEFSLVVWQSDGVNSVSLAESKGAAEQNFAHLSNDPDQLYSTLSTLISKAINNCLTQLLRTSFNSLPWQSVVAEVNSDLITIAAGESDHLDRGNLLDVMRPLSGEEGGVVYGPIATIQVIDIATSANARTRCTYYGENQTAAKVGDAVFVHDLGADRSGSHGQV